MFDHLHYVPILRWKKGEKDAIKKLNSSLKTNITPLIELIPTDANLEKKNKKIDTVATAEKFINALDDCWGKTAVFIDLHHLSGIDKTSQLTIDIFNNILVQSNNSNTNIIPVIYLDQDQFFNKTIKDVNEKYNTNSLCLRLDYRAILQAGFQSKIDQLLKDLKLAPKELDLIVDYGSIYNDIDPCIASNLFSNVPYIDSWKTFTFTSGVFPQYLSNIFRPGCHKMNRDDWIFWLNHLYKGASQRIPTFSDYTIQHPIYMGATPAYNPGANISYTSDHYWIIMKGKGIKKTKGGTGSAQYPANALLIRDSAEFCGKNFSYGDGYIFEKASDLNTVKTGSPTTWVEAGINHHITFVVAQLSSLSGS